RDGGPNLAPAARPAGKRHGTRRIARRAAALPRGCRYACTALQGRGIMAVLFGYPFNEVPLARRVVMPAVLLKAPDAVCAEARLRLEEITLALEEIPSESPLWASVRVSRLCVVVRGWFFFYEIGPETL